MTESEHRENGHHVAGDPHYNGFRITEMWVVTSVDPGDDQEGILLAPQSHMPLLMSDTVARDDIVEALTKYARHRLPDDAVLKHFVLQDTQKL